MKNKIILSSGSLYNYGLNRFFELAKKSGFDKIELCPDFRIDTQDSKYIKKLEQEYRIKVIALHYMMEFFGVWGDYKERITKSIRLAKNIKSKYLILHSWEYNDPEYNNYVLRNQNKIAETAQPVQIVFENSTKSFDPESPKKVLTDCFSPEYMNRFNNVLMDTSHVATAKLDLVKFYNKLNGKIKYIHFSDNDFSPRKDRPNSIEDSHLAPGYGKLPLKKFLKHLGSTKYQGIISIELMPSSIGAEKGEKVVLKNLISARKFVEKHL